MNRVPIAIASAAAAAICSTVHAATAPRPNIVHIIADDLGWGDVGFNGQTKIKTPNLDALRAAGMAMTNGYCPASVCAPTRAAMLSGFHNGHTYVDRNGGDISDGFRTEDFMLGQMLKQGGYRTGIIGKWGFGGNGDGAEMITAPQSLPNNHGYDEFYGYLNHTRAHDYFQPYVWQTNPSAPNGVEAVSTNNTYTHDLFQQRALQYVTNNAGAAQPFYLEFAPTIPHDQTADIMQVSGWDAEYSSAAYSSWTSGQKQVAAMVTRMDSGIGQLMARLDDPNGDGNTADSVRDDTLIIFTSDNGPTNLVTNSVSFFDSNGPYRGGKRDLTEGGLRTPFLMKWANEIAAGSSSDRVVDVADLFPTLAELAGVNETPVGMDGVSFAPVLTGDGVLRNREFFIFEGHEDNGGPLSQGPQLWAVRQGDWKLIKWGDGTYRLYNLATDPTEQTNVVSTNAAIKAGLEALALAEGVEQPTEYAVTYRTWSGANNATIGDDANWSGSGTPDNTWSAVVDNTAGGNRVANVTADVSFLGFGVRATSGTQRVVVNSGVTLTGQNEIRISANTQLDLVAATLRSNRWVDVRAGGTLFGRGDVFADIYNAGTVSASGGTLVLHGGGTHSGVFNTAAGAILEFAGGTHHIKGGTFTGLGTTRISGAALEVESPAIDITNLSVLNSGQLKLLAGGDKTLKVNTLSISGTSAKIDVSDNKLIVAAQGTAGTFNTVTGTYSGVTGLLQSGRNTGSWDGGGIMTSQSAADVDLTTLAVALANEIGRVGTTFGGRTLASGDVMVTYTLGGDADLNERIDVDDYFRIDSNYNKPPSTLGFSKGDFNYDGAIDGDDYHIIDAAFSVQAAAVNPDMTAVPEPAITASSALAVSIAASAGRRRRTKG